MAVNKSKTIKAMDTTDYSNIKPVEHVLLKPNTYVGSIRREKVEEFMFLNEDETKRIIKEQHDIPEGVRRVFIEALSNAGDNVIRSRERGFDEKYIDVEMTDKTIKVTNFGCPIPVKKDETMGKYVPDYLFTDMFSSSNYNKNVARKGAGTNGLGGKVVFIFSTKASVYVEDHINRKKFYQEHLNHLCSSSEPKVEEFKGSESKVVITYELDFEYFDMKHYTPEAFRLFERYTFDYSMSVFTETRFNGTVFKPITIPDMMAKYYNIQSENKLEWTWDKVPVKLGKDTDGSGKMSVYVMDTPFEGQSLGFVNGIMVNNGVHIMSIYKELAVHLTTFAKTSLFNVADIKHHITVIINCNLPDPEFTSQSKTDLSAPTPVLHSISTPSHWSPIKNWNVIERIKNIVEQKEKSKLAKTDGRKVRTVDVPKLDDAGWAGTSKSMQCNLYLTEGDSAKRYALIGRDSFTEGAFPLKGKMLNVVNATTKQIIKSSDGGEIGHIKQILGLRSDKDYSIEEERKKLRYGSCTILGDADDDGKHIELLVIAFFWKLYPTLLDTGFLKIQLTPIVRAKKGEGKNCKKYVFYTKSQFEKWRNSSLYNKNFDIEYFKGLGSHSDEDVLEYNKERIICTLIRDPDSDGFLKLVLDKNMSEERKEWIKTWREDLEATINNKLLNISDFVNNEFIHFCHASNKRAIPSFFDGLKPSQRQILQGTFKKWSSPKNAEPVKVSQLANYVSEHFEYHHGENSLMQAIISMTQSFVGANNAPYFKALGNFGSRHNGGEAASPRYIKLIPEAWIYTIFHPDDFPVLPRRINDDGEEEIETFRPVLPIYGLNGSVGIGLGWSTFIPPFNPEQTANWFLKRLDITESSPDKALPSVKPFYRGFTGKLSIVSSKRVKHMYQDSEPAKTVNELVKKSGKGKKKAEKVQNNKSILDFATVQEDDDADEDMDNNLKEDAKEFDTGFSSDDTMIDDPVQIVTEGTYTAVLHKGVFVTELPIGTWTNKYLDVAKGWVSESVISEVHNQSKEETNEVKIWLGDVENPSVKSLKLRTTQTMCNMTLLDENEHPTKHATIEEWFEKFYQHRITFYQKRKDYKLDDLRAKHKKLSEKRDYIQAVVSKQLVIINTKMADINERCKELGLDSSLLSLPGTQLTKEKIDELENDIAGLENQITELFQTPINELWKRDIQAFLVCYRKTIKNVK